MICKECLDELQSKDIIRPCKPLPDPDKEVYLTINPGESIKLDKSYKDIAKKDTKLRVDLVEPCLVEAAAEVQGFGVSKGYEANSWKDVCSIKESLASLERHLLKYKKGIELDEESKLSHMKHIVTRAMYILFLEEKEVKNNE